MSPMRWTLPTLLALALLAPAALATHRDGDPLLTVDPCRLLLHGPVACGEPLLTADLGDHQGSDGSSWYVLVAKTCAPGSTCAGTGEITAESDADARPRNDGHTWLVLLARACAGGAGCAGPGEVVLHP